MYTFQPLLNLKISGTIQIYISKARFSIGIFEEQHYKNRNIPTHLILYSLRGLALEYKGTY